eukprot:c21892_g1_i1 orf=293-526(+)
MEIWSSESWMGFDIIYKNKDDSKLPCKTSAVTAASLEDYFTMSILRPETIPQDGTNSTQPWINNALLTTAYFQNTEI